MDMTPNSTGRWISRLTGQHFMLAEKSAHTKGNQSQSCANHIGNERDA